MTNGIDTLPEDQDVPISGIASFTPKPRYEYGLVEEQLAPYSLNRLLQAFVPARQEVLEEPETQYRGAWDEMLLDEEGLPVIEREVKPGKYGEREWHPGYTPAFRAVKKGLGAVGDVMQDPSMIPRGIAKLPEFADAFMQQLRGSAQTATQGRLEGYDPETGEEFRALDIMSMAPVTMGPATAMSIARTAPTGEVFGIFGGRHMKSFKAKEKALKTLERKFAPSLRRGKTAPEVKQDFWDQQKGQKFKIYRSEVDNKPRIEIDTSEVRLLQNEIRGVDFLENVLEFPTLYKEYDRWIDIGPTPSGGGTIRVSPVSQITIQKMPAEYRGTASAYYDTAQDAIYVADGLSAEKMTSAILHELQHAIQYREGFPQGGSVTSVAPRNWRATKKKAIFREAGAEKKLIDKAAGEGVYDKLTTEKRWEVSEGFVEGGEAGEKMVDAVLGKGSYQQMRPRLTPNYIEEMKQSGQAADRARARHLGFEDLYEQLPGEVEARNVQARFLGATNPKTGSVYSAEELRNRHPDLTMDVPRKEMFYSIDDPTTTLVPGGSGVGEFNKGGGVNSLYIDQGVPVNGIASFRPSV